MSAVALPHVPSARAPSSAASSTRRSLHSASSTSSHVSGKSVRQHYDQEEEDDDEEEDEEEEDDENEPHETSHGSGSGGLWDEVESFLNKPSPSFTALAKETGNVRTTCSTGTSVLPTLRNGDRAKQPMAPPNGGGGGNQSGPRGSRPSVRVVTKQPMETRGLDPKLLQEAFAYAEKIQRVNLDDEDEEGGGDHDQQREAERRSSGVLRRDASGSGSHPRLTHDSGLQKQVSLRTKAGDENKPKKKSSIKSSAYGVSVKPHVSKKKPTAERRPNSKETTTTSGWDASPSSGDLNPHSDSVVHSRKSSASMDQQTIQSLVSTLQNGTALDDLRRELAVSQQSLAMSRQVIQDAAKSFFRK